MTTPPVTVVIPAYNRAGSIALAIESVLRQSWGAFELLVVDDGSTDGTQDVVRGIADPRLRLIETPRNMGASAARNLGIEEARGDWVAFQDSDDEWLPLKLEKQMARLLAPGADHVAAYCGMMILGEPHGPETETETGAPGRLVARYYPGPEETVVEGDLLAALLRSSLISTQTLVARRDALREAGGFDPEIRALIDWDCVIRLAGLGTIAFVDEPLVLQRFSANSITKDRLRKLPTQIRIAEKYGALLERHPEAMARQQYVIAGGQRMAGNLPAARAAIAKARAARPGDPRLWAMSAWLELLRLAPRKRPPAGG